MSERRRLEWKTSWHDDYLKSVCAFANAGSGALEGGVDFLRIVVEPYPVSISCRGVYYQRSGSTNQVLRSPALDRFLLGKTGRCWDGMPDPRVALEDLDPVAIRELIRFSSLGVRSEDVPCMT